MVTISLTEYERFRTQRERLSALEKQAEFLVEAVRLSRKKRFSRLEGAPDECLVKNKKQ